MSTVWDPATYERYKSYRDRPALDLLLQIPGDLDPGEIWDLGCGVGEHAALLAARHSGARVRGMDSSPEMLAAARKRACAVEWIEGDIAAFAPEAAPDLIFSNAALQWLPDHAALFPRLMRVLAPGGVLACQMPTADGALHRQALEETIQDGPWAGVLSGLRAVHPTAAPQAYYDWIAPHSASVDIWQTTYMHVMESVDAIVEWMEGTGLRPYLQALRGAERGAFLNALQARLEQAFEVRPDGRVLFPFPRLFIVARRSPAPLPG